MNDDNFQSSLLPNFFTDPNVRFPAWPQLVPDLRIFQMPHGLGFQFRGAASVFMIRGRNSEEALTFLLPRLDGTRTLADLLDQRPADLSQPTILQGLKLLHMKGALIDARPRGSSDGDDLEAPSVAGISRSDATMGRQLLFWGRKLTQTGYLASASDVQERLSNATVVLIGTGLFGVVTYDLLRRSGCLKLNVVPWDDDGFLTESLSDSHYAHPEPLRMLTSSISTTISSVAELAEHADLVLLATRNAPAALMRSLNRICLDSNCPYVRANEDGVDFELGPYVLPYRSACYTCMELRESSVREFTLEEALYHEDLAKERPAGEGPLKGESVVTATLGASILTLEAIRILSGIAAPTLLNSVLTISLLEGSYRSNRILRVPRCTDCFPGAARKSLRRSRGRHPPMPPQARPRCPQPRPRLG